MERKTTLHLFIISLIIAGLLIPSVNAQIDNEILTANRVDLNTAYQSAVISANSYIAHGIAGCFDDPSIWKGAYVEKNDPLEVYDLSGELLYYEFDIIKDGTTIGEVRASANKLLGCIAPVISCTPNKLMENLTYYSDYYKKLGCQVKIISYVSGQALLINCNDSGEESYIFDVYWIKEIPAEHVESFYLNYNKNPEEEIARWNKEFDSMASAYIQSSRLGRNTSTDTINMSGDYQTKIPETKTSPGFSGILAITTMALFIFACKKS